MRLWSITESDSSTHLYRGETTTATEVEVVEAIKSGDYWGRYFTYGDRAAATAYAGSHNYIVEFNIPHEELVAENVPIITTLLDWQTEEYGADCGITPSSTIEHVGKVLSKHGIPAKFAEQYLKCFLQRVKSSKSGEVNASLLSEYGDLIHHCDGPVTIDCVVLCQRLSQYLKNKWSQVALLLRPVEPSELVRIIRV